MIHYRYWGISPFLADFFMEKKTYLFSRQTYLDNDTEHYTYLPGVYVISVAARMARMHPQTLRKYERHGVVSPNRTTGSQRLYSDMDVHRLLVTKKLIDDFGLNLNGITLVLKILDVLNSWKISIDKKRQFNDSTELREISHNIKSLINSIAPDHK